MYPGYNIVIPGLEHILNISVQVVYDVRSVIINLPLILLFSILLNLLLMFKFSKVVNLEVKLNILEVLVVILLSKVFKLVFATLSKMGGVGDKIDWHLCC